MNLNKLNTNFQKLKKLGLAFPELLGATSFKVTPFEYKVNLVNLNRIIV